MDFYLSDIGSVIAVILSLLAAIILAAIYAPKKNRSELTGFGAWLNDLFNFRSLFIEKILKFLYILATCFCIITGIIGIIEGLIDGHDIANVLYALLFTVVGPIAIRLAFELIMMAVLLVTNVIEINKKLGNAPKEDTAPAAAPAPAYAPQPQAVQEPRYTYCTQCGMKFDESLPNCPNCGKR